MDLNHLPKRGSGLRIDWVNSIGYKCIFTYENVNGELEIVNYDKSTQFITIKYKDKIDSMHTTSFTKCSFGKILGFITNEFKVNVGDTFKDNKRDLIITDREYREGKKGHNWKWYKYTCNKCGWTEGWMTEGGLLTLKNGCSCCCRRTAVKGINDIATTDFWMIDYLADKEDAYKYVSQSNIWTIMRCPTCGFEKEMRISTLYANGFACNKCYDGFSYPNKFIINLLDQLNVDYKNEYSPKWIGRKAYDIFIPSFNLIIEMDGGFGHGNRDTNYMTKEESKNLDEWKDEQAKKHGLEVVRIDCDYGDILTRFEFIKHNILKSKLSNIFDFQYISWLECNEYASKNIIKEVCLYYELNKDDIFMNDIYKKFKISNNALVRYLKIGTKVGWCEYDVNHRYKKVFVKELNETFDTIANCEKELSERYCKRFSRGNIHMVCTGKRKSHHGFHFEFIK